MTMRSAVRVVAVALGVLSPILAAVPLPPAGGIAPDVAIWSQVDAATADPQDLLTFTIWVHNRGPGPAPSVWVNDTIPSGAVYVNDTADTDIGPPVFLGRSFGGNAVRWQFAAYPMGNRSFRMRAQVGFGVSDGSVLQNVAVLSYTNATGVAQPTQSTFATTTISIPVVSATISGTFTAADAIAYRVTISNTGSSAARALWWNDTLPAGVQFVRVAGVPPPLGAVCASLRQWVNCTLTSPFGPGSKSWEIGATIPTPLPPGSTLVTWLFVNYTDGDGTYLGESRAFAALTTGLANLRVVALVDTPRVAPGGTIGYTIFYNNTGQGAAGDVWINDTLPQSNSLPAVSVLAASPAPIASTPTGVRWTFRNVPAGVHSVSLSVRVLSSLGDGFVLMNHATLNYTTPAGEDRPGSASSARSIVSLSVPDIAAELVPARSTVEPGGRIAYTLYYNNTRPALAAYVFIEVVLPPKVPFSSADPAYSATALGRYLWNLTGIGPGEHRIAIVAIVPLNVPRGTVLRTTAFANYTDDRGERAGGSRTSADVTVDIPAPLPPPPPYLVIAFGVVVLVAIAAASVRLYLAAIQETVIDEAFLLRRDGLLVKHYARSPSAEADSRGLSGMLIAVQSFVNEGFIGMGLTRERQLDGMTFGDRRILLLRGEHVIVAAVVSGPQVNRIPAQVRAAISDIEAELGPVLEKWDGDVNAVAPADRTMRDLVSGKYRARAKFHRGNH